MSDLEKSVLVLNLTSTTTEETISDFFSFCGKISSLALTKVSETQAQAIIRFETTGAAKTALLLNNALINESPIQVQPYGIEQNPEPKPMPQEYEPQKHSIGAEEEQYKQASQEAQSLEGGEQRPNFISSLLAGAWSLGTAAGDKIKEMDEKVRFTETVKRSASNIAEKMKNFDDEHNISKTAQNMVNTIGEKVKAVDERFGVSQKTSVAANKINETVQGVTRSVTGGVDSVTAGVNDTVDQNETLRGGVDSLHRMSSSLAVEADKIGSETNKLIDEKRRSVLEQKSDLADFDAENDDLDEGDEKQGLLDGSNDVDSGNVDNSNVNQNNVTSVD